jgi:hypothetical protein
MLPCMIFAVVGNIKSIAIFIFLLIIFVVTWITAKCGRSSPLILRFFYFIKSIVGEYPLIPQCKWTPRADDSAFSFVYSFDIKLETKKIRNFATRKTEQTMIIFSQTHLPENRVCVGLYHMLLLASLMAPKAIQQYIQRLYNPWKFCQFVILFFLSLFEI